MLEAFLLYRYLKHVNLNLKHKFSPQFPLDVYVESNPCLCGGYQFILISNNISLMVSRWEFMYLLKALVIQGPIVINRSRKAKVCMRLTSEIL